MIEDPVSAVVFDLDGTLIATKRLYLECYRRSLAPIMGSDLGDEALLAMKPRSERHLIRSQVDEERLDACLDDFYRHYETLHLRLFEGVYPGVRQALDSIRAAGRFVGIVTGKSERAWQITRRHVGLGPFDVLVLDDHVPRPKPDPAGIRLAVERLRVPPASTIYVGDTLGDVRAARAAGVHPVAALWSKTGERRRAFSLRAQAEGARLASSPAAVARIAGVVAGLAVPRDLRG